LVNYAIDSRKPQGDRKGPHPYNDYEGVASSIAFGEPIFRESI